MCSLRLILLQTTLPLLIWRLGVGCKVWATVKEAVVGIPEVGFVVPYGSLVGIVVSSKKWNWLRNALDFT